jgi:probable F420-dependent oxidoreductase
VRLGVHARVTADSDAAAIARRAEELGFESLFVPEHTHIPLTVERAHGQIPPWLRVQMQLLDPFVALSAAAAVTDRLLLGTGVCLAAFHDPIVLAKQVASLDVLSRGRFLFGVGAGSHADEARNHGVDPGRRWARTLEAVAAVKRIWTSEEPSFDGEWVRFEPLRQWPKPAQRPHPPILLGGESDRTLERARSNGYEWLPHHSDALLSRLQRGVEDVRVTVFAPARDERVLASYEAAGAVRCVVQLEPDEPVDALAELIA